MAILRSPRVTGLALSLVLSAAVLADHHLSELASPLIPGESVSRTLASGDNHYFELLIEEAGTLTVYTEGAVDTFGQFMRIDEQVILDDNDSGAGDNFHFETDVAPGSYFVRVLGATPFETGDFTLVTVFAGEGAASPEELALEVNLGSVRNTDNSASSAVLMAGAALRGDQTSRSDFQAGDLIDIYGAVMAQEADRGRAADIFVVIRSIVDGASSWTYRDEDGVFRPWDTKVPSLAPAYRAAALGESEVVEIHRGTLQAASHRVFIGYRLEEEGAPLHYNTNGMRLDVAP